MSVLLFETDLLEWHIFFVIDTLIFGTLLVHLIPYSPDWMAGGLSVGQNRLLAKVGGIRSVIRHRLRHRTFETCSFEIPRWPLCCWEIGMGKG